MGNRFLSAEDLEQQRQLDEKVGKFLEKCKDPQVQALREMLEQSSLPVNGRLKILSLPWDLIRASDTNKKIYLN